MIEIGMMILKGVKLSKGVILQTQATQLCNTQAYETRTGLRFMRGDVCRNFYSPLGSAKYQRYYHDSEVYFSNQGVGIKVIADGKFQVDLPKDLLGNKFADDTYHKEVSGKPIINSIIGVGGDRWEVIGTIHDTEPIKK